MSTVADIPAPIPVADGAGASSGLAAATLARRWAALDAAVRWRWLAGGVLALVAAMAAAFFYRAPPYKVLFANLNDKDGGAIVAQLAQMNVPYQYTEGGGAILVPAARVHDVRLKLATLGLPKAAVTGFELTESNPFGITQFQERLNFQRGLEGELTRSIQALAAVQSARVHLALPNQNGFFREQQKPSASVLVSLYPGRMLDGAQIAGIVHLVASSVPEMQPGSVNVLDDSGKLLSGHEDSEQALEMRQLAYTREVEQQYVQRIVDILEPVVGAGNVRAQVAAQMDFSQREETAEQHRPNQTQDAGVVRSQQVVVSSGEGTPPQPAGVPGAASNQPPQAASAPINGQNPAPQAASGQDGAAAPGSKVYGRLSVMLQAGCEVVPLFDIGPEAFHPPPKVDSALVRLVPRNPATVGIRNPARFAQIVKAAFGQRRKTLRNALSGVLESEAIAAAGIPPQARAEQVSVAEFVALGNVPAE